jgi:hypothetical protein
VRRLQKEKKITETKRNEKTSSRNEIRQLAFIVWLSDVSGESSVYYSVKKKGRLDLGGLEFKSPHSAISMARDLVFPDCWATSTKIL